MMEITYEDRQSREFIETKVLLDRVVEAINDDGTLAFRAVKCGRNDSCPCGSGRKFKKCCIIKVNKPAEILHRLPFKTAMKGTPDV
ncbi:MAG TPA: hypothetical protein ENI27_09255 [bacterium]|nr:hypothetical protein [bacterium]